MGTCPRSFGCGMIIYIPYPCGAINGLGLFLTELGLLYGKEVNYSDSPDDI
jgi:hypothetical protein